MKFALIFLAILFFFEDSRAETAASADSLEVRFFAKVHSAPSENSPLLGVSGDGNRLFILDRKGDWMAVRFGRAKGWILQSPRQGFPPAVSQAKPARVESVNPGRHYFLAAIPALLFALFLAASLVYRRLRGSIKPKGPATQPVDCEHRVFLLAHRDTLLQSSVAGHYITLSKCLRDLGFKVVFCRNLAGVAKALPAGAPGLLGVDCKLGPRILGDVARFGNSHPELRASVVFFYNAARPDALQPPSSLPNAHYLGQALASHHIMEIVTPAFDFESVSRTQPGNPNPCVLEGAVTLNGLAEILQFLEIGRRTGLLSLEDENPTGVIAFSDGDITFAQTRLREGLDAVFEVLALSRGTFRFFADKGIRQGCMRISATQALLQWARKVDESGAIAAIRP